MTISSVSRFRQMRTDSILSRLIFLADMHCAGFYGFELSNGVIVSQGFGDYDPSTLHAYLFYSLIFHCQLEWNNRRSEE